MGQFISATNFSGIVWKERYFESGEYDNIGVFTPMVVTFDVNPDSLAVENLEEVLPGTKMEVNVYYNGPLNRRYFVTDEVSTPNDGTVMSAQDTYLGYLSRHRIAITVGGTPIYNSEIVVEDNSDSYVGASIGLYYFRPSDRVYIFYKLFFEDDTKTFLGSRSYNFSEITGNLKWLFDRFYPTVSPYYYLTLISPRSRFFNVGQSSELKFALKGTDFEREVDATITPTSIPANWNYDENTKTLTLLSETTLYASVEATYEADEYTYNETVTFFPAVSNPYAGGGISVPAGGGGSFGRDEVSDTIDVPTSSAAGNLSDSSTFTRYLVNETYLDILGEWLWTDSLGLQVAKSFISLLYGDPSQSIISLMSYPFDIQRMSGVSTTRQEFYWGSHPAGFDATVITTNSVYVNWGTVGLQEYWGNFLDYAPHTKIQLYLPWGTGFVDIDPGEVLPGSISVITNIDLLKGSCIHIVTNKNGNPIGTYSGQCAQQIPMFASDFASKMAGIVTAGVASLVGGGTIAAAGAAGALEGGLESIVHSVGGRGIVTEDRLSNAAFGAVRGAQHAMSGRGNFGGAARLAGKIATTSLAVNRSPVTVSRSGSFTDGSAALGVQYPYLIISRPTQSMPAEYGHHFGYPSNIYSNLGVLRGYTEVGEVHLEGIAATETELAEIDRLLKGGVIL